MYKARILMSTDKELCDAFTDYYFMVFSKFLGCVTSERTDIKCIPTIKPHMEALRLREIVDVQ